MNDLRTGMLSGDVHLVEKKVDPQRPLAAARRRPQTTQLYLQQLAAGWLGRGARRLAGSNRGCAFVEAALAGLRNVYAVARVWLQQAPRLPGNCRHIVKATSFTSWPFYGGLCDQETRLYTIIARLRQRMPLFARRAGPCPGPSARRHVRP